MNDPNIPNPRNLDDNQRLLFEIAIHPNGPFITNDPMVNHAVDCHMDDSNIPYDENEYRDEIIAWKNSGGLILGWIA